VPQLHLEYMPEGSIADHLEASHTFSRYECTQILEQTLDGLAYLHGLDPKIVHRDVKPSNILILHRRPDTIFVKFADFGLSREGDSLKTICGTFVYLAPEVYGKNTIPLEKRESYTPLVDVWSLGVVLVELLCRLPEHKGPKGMKWCERVREWAAMTLGPAGDDLLSFVLESMLCLEPEARTSAADCHTKAKLLLEHAQSNRRVGGDHCSDSLETRVSTIRQGEAGRRRSNNTEMESNRRVGGDHCWDSLEAGASTIRQGEAGRRRSNSIKMESCDTSGGSSSLSRYTVRDSGQRYDRSHNAQSSETVPESTGQLLSRFRDPEDSLFYKSGFGEDSDGGSGDGEESDSASMVVMAQDVEPQAERVEGSSVRVLEFAASLEPDELEDMPPEMPIRELPVNAFMVMIEEPRMRTSNRTGATHSVKRSRTAR
jgi:serine/threonine protein kinase